MEEVYAKLRGRFVFGKWQKHHGKYSGKVVEQDMSTYEVTYHQIPDIEASIRTVTLSKEQQVMSPDSLIDASVAAELRSIVGSVSYFARESRPDIAGEAAICQGMFPQADDQGPCRDESDVQEADPEASQDHLPLCQRASVAASV